MDDIKCKYCGNSYHWHHAFSKFGYDDGDGDVQTPHVAKVLEDAGYSVKYSRWSPHNTIIYSIQKGGMELMPINNHKHRIGYDDPGSYLPEEILDLLNTEIITDRIFQ